MHGNVFALHISKGRRGRRPLRNPHCTWKCVGDGALDIPPENAIRVFLENGSWFAIRPSGTEPKIKFYFYSIQDSNEKAAEVNRKIKEEVFAMVQSVE